MRRLARWIAVRTCKLVLLAGLSLIVFSCGKKGPPTLKDYQSRSGYACGPTVGDQWSRFF